MVRQGLEAKVRMDGNLTIRATQGLQKGVEVIQGGPGKKKHLKIESDAWLNHLGWFSQINYFQVHRVLRGWF